MRLFLLCMFCLFWSPGLSWAQSDSESLPALENNILSQFDAEQDMPRLSDDFEGYNRAMHEVNLVLDKIFIRPAARGYKAVTPRGLRDSVGNFFSNLQEPYSALNNILQGDLHGFGENMSRFAVNSSIGILGIFDIAGAAGYAPDNEDLGQTLAVWGVPSGGYLVLPLLGPNSVRSAVGAIGGNFADPVAVAIRNNTDAGVPYVLAYGDAVSNRSSQLDILQDLEANSVDFYSALRSLYWQNRNNAIAR